VAREAAGWGLKPVAGADFREFLRRSAREMRSHPTDVERALWWRLRNRKLGGLKFRRQRPEGPYIADFVCREAKLIVEVDGAQHRGSIADRLRTQHLTRIGFDVVRFSNEEVRADLDAVCARILRIAKMPT
jgi:very-short-patch-repair endonuclease